MQHSVSKVVLKNGIEGLFIDVPSASVTSIDIAFRAGDYLSPHGKTDTAHVMEHLVLGANKKYPTAKEFSKEFSKYGAYNNAYTGDYHMGYEAECEAGETERIIDLLCIAIESPLFTQADFASEIGNVREELKMRRNNDEVELSLLLENAMGFVPKSYRERAKELPAITLSDVERHYRLTHTTTNMRFIIAGPIAQTQQAIINRLESIQLKKGTGYIALPDEVPHILAKPLVLQNNNLDNVCYRWEVVLPRFTDYIARDSLAALQDILFNGFHSRVFGELREKGLVYGIFGNYYETKQNAVSVINGQVQVKNIKKVFTILMREINDIAQKGVFSNELLDFKKRAYGEIQRYHQTPGQLNGWYRQAFINRNEITPFDAMNDRLNAITNDSIMRSAELLLVSEVFGLGFMHNKADTLEANELAVILR